MSLPKGNWTRGESRVLAVLRTTGSWSTGAEVDRLAQAPGCEVEGSPVAELLLDVPGPGNTPRLSVSTQLSTVPPHGPLGTVQQRRAVTFKLQTVHALDALGNPVRRKILRQLRDAPLSVNELAARFPISRPAISRHIHVLAQSGLVEARGSGARHQYAIRLKGFAPVRDFLDEFWDSALARLEELSRKKPVH